MLILSRIAGLGSGDIDFGEEITDMLFRDQRPSKRDLVLKLILQIYAELNQEGNMWFDGSANLIVPALASKPFGMCPWQELEGELGSNIRPSTFAQKIRALTHIHATVFTIRGANHEKILVIPEESLPALRNNFNLPARLPEETETDFGKQSPPRDLKEMLDQVPIFTLLNPRSDEIFELLLVKDSGKRGTLLFPSTATFRELHGALQEFAGWDDEHLHEFQVKVVDPEPDIIVVNGLTPDWMPVEYMTPGDYREDQVHLGQLLSGKNDTVQYHYDFGDQRYVKIKVARVVPRDEHATYPQLLRPTPRKKRAKPNRRTQSKGRGTGE